jgi:hypothetical protein
LETPWYPSLKPKRESAAAAVDAAAKTVKANMTKRNQYFSDLINITPSLRVLMSRDLGD